MRPLRSTSRLRVAQRVKFFTNTRTALDDPDHSIVPHTRVSLARGRSRSDIMMQQTSNRATPRVAPTRARRGRVVAFFAKGRLRYEAAHTHSTDKIICSPPPASQLHSRAHAQRGQGFSGSLPFHPGQRGLVDLGAFRKRDIKRASIGHIAQRTRPLLGRVAAPGATAVFRSVKRPLEAWIPTWRALIAPVRARSPPEERSM